MFNLTKNLELVDTFEMVIRIRFILQKKKNTNTVIYTIIIIKK